MAWAYFDTSALIKRYIDEPGRSEVMRLLRRHDCVISALLPVELRSVLRRRTSEGTVTPAQVIQTLQRFTMDRARWAVVELESGVLNAAELLVAAHPLRTLDAIHVASAQIFAARVDAPELIFVSADTRQIAAASAVGMTVRRIAS